MNLRESLKVLAEPDRAVRNLDEFDRSRVRTDRSPEEQEVRGPARPSATRT
jgi:hypothetical protein